MVHFLVHELNEKLIPLEKYNIFQTNLVKYYHDSHLGDVVTRLIKIEQLTIVNYRDFCKYDRALTEIAIDFHKAQKLYLNNSFNLSFASIFMDGTKSDIVLSQVARYEKKSLEEVKSMDYQERAKKSAIIMVKEMILAIIETKLNSDQF